MTEVSAHIAKRQASRTDGAVFYFSCSMESPVATTFAHSVLRHILNGSDHRQAKLITNTFLSTLLLKILERDQSRFQDDDSSIMTVEKILNASDGELLGALIKTVVKIKHIQDTPIIIDGIDKIGQDGALFIRNFCSQMIASPKFKVLLTCRPDPDIKTLVSGVPCIEYDKERKGLEHPLH